MRNGRRQMAKHPLRDGIFRRARDDVGGRALQHGDVGGRLGELWNEGDGGGATADYDHALGVATEIFGPVLGVKDADAEAIHAGPAGHITLGVIVVAAANVKKIAGEASGLFFRACRVNGPESLRRGPRSAGNLMTETNFAVDAIFANSFLKIFENGRTTRDGFLVSPGAETEAERVHVRIGTDARIAEEVPGSANRVAAFQNYESF